MTIVVAGGSGFIGTEFINQVSASHKIILLTRKPESVRLLSDRSVRVVQWDGLSLGPWTEHVDGADAVVNLAGVPIAGKRWTKAQKERIVESRTYATRAVVEAIAKARKKPPVLVNISGVGYYGNVDSGDVTESHPNGNDFLASVCRRWEQEASAGRKFGARVVIPRLGVVLGKGGGALQKMITPFKLYAGGPLGSGKQWFPWIHIDDVVGIIMFAIERQSLRGPVNAAAPQVVTMKEFCSTLGNVMQRPSWAPVPSLILKVAFGEMADMLLTGQRVIPKKLQDEGYKFQYPALEDALQAILQK
jgi:uncharacterized protein (TIGR01777 family)